MIHNIATSSQVSWLRHVVWQFVLVLGTKTLIICQDIPSPWGQEVIFLRCLLRSLLVFIFWVTYLRMTILCPFCGAAACFICCRILGGTGFREKSQESRRMQEVSSSLCMEARNAKPLYLQRQFWLQAALFPSTWKTPLTWFTYMIAWLLGLRNMVCFDTQMMTSLCLFGTTAVISLQPTSLLYASSIWMPFGRSFSFALIVSWKYLTKRT